MGIFAKNVRGVHTIMYGSKLPSFHCT